MKILLLKKTANLNDGDAVFFSCGNEMEAAKIAGLVRTKLGEDLDLIDNFLLNNLLFIILMKKSVN